MNITVKPTEECEALRLSEIQKAAFLPLYQKYHDAKNPYLRGVEDITDRLNSEDFRSFTVLEGGRIIGAVRYKCRGKGIFFDSLGENEFYLARVFIDPEYQGKGAAYTAIMLCENEFKNAEWFGVDFPVDLLKNRRCYEKAGYRDTGRRAEAEKGLVLACYEKYICRKENSIRAITYNMLPQVLQTVRKSFKTAADEFGLTKDNCPKHTSFIPMEFLETHMRWGWYMFGAFDDDRLIGYASLSNRENGVYELHNLAVLPEYRHKGVGKALLDHAKQKAQSLGGTKISIGIIEESKVLKNWYIINGFEHTGIKKFEHLPFTTGFMEYTVKEK